MPPSQPIKCLTLSIPFWLHLIFPFILIDLCKSFTFACAVLNQKTVFILFTLIWACIFSKLFSIHFIEKLTWRICLTIQCLRVVDHFLNSRAPIVWFREWCCKEKLDAGHKGLRNLTWASSESGCTSLSRTRSWSREAYGTHTLGLVPCKASWE